MIRRVWTLVVVSTGAMAGWWVVSRLLSRMGPEPVPGRGLKPSAPRDVIPLHISAQPAEVAAPPTQPGAPGEETGAGADQEEEVRVYCLGCRTKQPVRDVEYTTTSQGRRRLSGRCAVCGRKVSQFVKSG